MLGDLAFKALVVVYHLGKLIIETFLEFVRRQKLEALGRHHPSERLLMVIQGSFNHRVSTLALV